MLPEQPAPELLDAVALADGLGYYGCYGADEIYHKDAWLLFAAAAQRTERIRLGPCVAPIYMREPTYIAQLAATLDELSGGRAEVVFGIGNIAMLEQYGVEWRGTRPIARLREAHQVMRTVLDEGAIDFKGDFYSYTGVTTAARPVQEHLPLKVGAMGGPKSMQLAGEIADGLLTACAYSPEALGYAVEHFRVGTERAGARPGRSRSRRLPARRDRSRRRRCTSRRTSARGVLHPIDAAGAARAARDRAGAAHARHRGVRRRRCQRRARGHATGDCQPDHARRHARGLGAVVDGDLRSRGSQPRARVLRGSIHLESLGRGRGRRLSRLGRTGADRGRAGHPRAELDRRRGCLSRRCACGDL